MNTLAWPPERFYWSILEGADWKRPGVLPAGLRPPFDDDVPAAGDELHAVCAPLGSDRVLICAARCEDLKSIDPEVVKIVPSALPPFVQSGIDLESLNLLVGEFEPRSHRRARQRRHLAAAAMILLCSVLVAIGLARRAEHHTLAAEKARQATAALIAEVAPAARPETLGFELAALRRSSEAGQRIRPPVDASLALVELLRGWPADGSIASKPQSIAISANSIALSVLVEDDAAGFLDALKGPAGWRMEQPRMSSVDTTVRLAIQFRPTGDQQ